MTELVRGNVTDRPWGRTLATLALRGVSGQLTLFADGKRFLVAFERGAIVAAMSPLASDAAVRVALTAHLISSSQVPEISRRQAATPERDEIELIAELARLGPEHALRLRRRAIAQRAARTFAITQGEFVVTDQTELPIIAGCELDVRAVIYMGARANLSEQRLQAEVDQLGAWFRLKSTVDDDLPQFGFGDVEQPVVERLRDGGTMEELEAFAASFVDPRTVRAVVYALASHNACDAELDPPGLTSRPSVPPLAPPQPGRTPAAHKPLVETQPLPRTGPVTTSAPQAPKTQPLPRSLTPPAPPEMPRAPTPPFRPPRPTAVPPLAQRGSGSTIPPVPPASGDALDARRSNQSTTRIPTAPPPPRQTMSPLAAGSTGLRPLEQREGSPAGLRLPADDELSGALAEDGSDLDQRPTRETQAQRAGSDPALRLPPDDARGAERPLRTGRDTARSQAGLRLPPDEAHDTEQPQRARRDTPRGSGSQVGLRLPPDDAHDTEQPQRARRDTPRGSGSQAGLRLPPDDASGAERPQRASRESVRPGGSDPALRLPADDSQRREGSDPSLRRPRDTPAPGSDPSLRRPRDTPAPGSDPSLRRPRDTPVPGWRDGSDAALQLPADAALRREVEGPEAGPQLVRRRIASSRPPIARQISRTDSPKSHDVKALIAQRLKLLDQSADHFQLLGVALDVSPDGLRRAYFALARQLHPDRLAALGISDDGKHAQRLFAQINAGFAILSDPERRADYVGVLRQGGEAAVRAEQARAEELARQILDAEEAFRRGELALRRDQPAAAVTELELAVKLNPDEADYHALLAWSRFCAAADKPAVAATTRAALDKAIQRAPKAIGARFYLGRVERMLGRDPEALRHFREVVAAVPGHADAAAEIRAIEARIASDKTRRR